MPCLNCTCKKEETLVSKKIKDLAPEKLRNTCNPAQFNFKTTEELPPLKEVVGQERAVNAIDFGVNIKNYGYNIYVLGPGGAGRTSTIKEAIKRRAKNLPPPDDWCYVYSFDNPDQPYAICLPAGKAKIFKTKMDHFIQELQKEIPLALNSEDFQKERNDIIQNFQQKQNNALIQLDKKAKSKDFLLQKKTSGFVLVPTKNGEVLTSELYNKLSNEDKEKLDQQSKVLQQELHETLLDIRKIENQITKDVQKLERNVVKFAIGHLMDELKEEFQHYDQVINYLNQVQENLLANIGEFKSSADDRDKSSMQSVDHSFERFRVNVIVDNSKTKGAPVVVETNPTYNNLIGRIEKKTHLGTLVTDFTMIKAGALHKANRGFLIIEAEHIYGYYYSWDALKQALKNQALKITDLSEEYSFVSAKTLEPEPIPLDVKIVLIGKERTYYSLYNWDDDFKELFKVKADFNVQMKRTKKNMLKYAQFIGNQCRKENLLHLNEHAVARVVEYGSELCQDQTKLSTKFSEICNLIREANYWALKNKQNVVTSQDIQKAIDERISRFNRVEEAVQENIENGTTFIHTHGEKVGEVNGLSVRDYGDFCFGKPSRITVRTYSGKAGVIAIDREVKMTGSIYEKGVLILSGYLNGKFGQKKQLSMSASITFEQSYSGVDGDSASSTELYGILSSLSGYHIKQGIAVTGSVNQLGEIQPIGAAIEKIEGFFDVCKAKKLTSEQGVIIPKTNIKNLMLKQEILEAVREGKFHIYPVSTVDEGIEILTGVPAGKPKKDGTYPENTVFGAVEKCLNEFDEPLKGKENNSKNEKKNKKQKENNNK